MLSACSLISKGSNQLHSLTYHFFFGEMPSLFALLIILYTGHSTTLGLLLRPDISKFASFRKSSVLSFSPPPIRRSHPLLQPQQQQQQRTKKSTSTTTTRLRLAAAAFRIASHGIESLLPLVKANDVWGNVSVLTFSAALAQVLGKTTVLGRLLGPPVTAMALTFFLATMGVIQAGGTAAAASLQLLALQLATPLILLGADLRDAPRRCGPLLVSFFAASSATVVACVLAWQCVGKWLQVALGSNHDGLVIAAALMAKNIGGGINYMAVCTSLSASPTAIAAGLCVDNIFALVYFPATSIFAAGRPDVSMPDDRTATISTTHTLSSNSTDADDCAASNDKRSVETTTAEQKSLISVEHVSTVLVLSTTLLWLGERLGGSMGGGALPTCTLLTVLLASNAPTSWMTPLQPAAHVLGVVCLYLFFATAGAPGLAVADSVKASIVPLSAFLGILYSVHGLILVAAHSLFGRSRPRRGNASDPNSRRSGFLSAAFVPQRLLVASSAAIGGPATAVALAQAASWESLSAPSLLVGNVGYAIATFLGLLYHAYFR
jgi:uncharacterized membrane protein